MTRRPGALLLLGLLLVAGPAAAQTREAEEVRFESDGLRLAGTLLLPEGEGPFPGIAFIHGSGEADRTHYWARLLADFLVANGFAFLLPDKRGSGESEGDWRTSDFHDLADDALAAVGLLRARPEVDPAAIGLLGFSQGGRIAPIAAARSDAVRFVVNVSGSAVLFSEQLDHEMRNRFRDAGLEGAEARAAMELHRSAEAYVRGEIGWDGYRASLDAALESEWAEVARGFPQTPDEWRWEFFRGVVDYDPIPWWRRVSQPILVIYGREDERENVPVAESVGRLEAALAASGHRDGMVWVFEDAGHGLWEEGTHPPRHRADFLRTLLDWLRARAR